MHPPCKSKEGFRDASSFEYYVNEQFFSGVMDCLRDANSLQHPFTTKKNLRRSEYLPRNMAWMLIYAKSVCKQR